MKKQNFTILFLSVTVLVSLSISIIGSDKALRTLWNIPTMHPIFADLHTITGVNETLAQGKDPLVQNPGDPWNRTMNYPRIWQHIAIFFNLDHSIASYFGLLNIALYLLGFYIFAARLRLTNILVFLLFITFFSPASFLAMERGNIDLIIFFLLSLSLVYASKPIIFSTIVFIASVLKIFPVFALSGLLNQSRSQFVKYFAISSTCFIAYVFLTLNDIVLIINGTPQSNVLSYGINIIWSGVNYRFGDSIGALFKTATIIYISGVFVSALVLSKKIKLPSLDVTYVDSFRIGSAIFIATYILSNNWDYRLIFLLFTIPQIYEWLRSDTIIIVKIIALIALVSLLFTHWYLDLRSINTIITWWIDEISNLLLFSSLLFLFVISLPTWLLHFFKIKASGTKTYNNFA